MTASGMPIVRWTTVAGAIPRGYAQTSYSSLHARYIRPARAIDAQRRTLEPPAKQLLEWLAAQPGVAVTGVAVSPESLADVYGYLAEPAYRLGVPLIIVADRALEDLNELEAAEPQVGYAWSLQRLRYLCARDSAPRRWPAANTTMRLDDSQRAAVSAHDGVVQIIAPAGSGKTTVLIARAAELVARGVPAQRILCTTFNKDAQLEMQARLLDAGLHDVRAQTFHSLGFRILRDCDGLRVRRHPHAQPRAVAPAVRSRVEGESRQRVDRAAAGPRDGQRDQARPADDPAGVPASTPPPTRPARPSRRSTTSTSRSWPARTPTTSTISSSCRCAGLQRDAQLRERWQRRYDHVLVDEYQDIDPAQETLVQILAAPQDGLFAVGDEDQTLYAWRSASVERIVGLDGLYPGLQRVALDHNYRCPPEVVQRSRQVIEHNRSRFPKPILPADARTLPDDPRPVIHQAYASLEAGAADVARKLSVSRRGEIVVLARTSRMLRICAEACVAPDVKISAPENVFEPAGARAALESYCRLLGDTRDARPEDVATVFRHPGRGLPFGAEQPVADALADGVTFEQAVAGLRDIADHARQRVIDGARILDTALTL